jgi:hypothetical protein
MDRHGAVLFSALLGLRIEAATAPVEVAKRGSVIRGFGQL